MAPRFRFVFRQAMRAMTRSLGVTALAVLTMAASLAVLAAFALVVGHLRQLAENLGQDVGLSAYLEPGAQGELLAREAAKWEGVDRSFVLTSSEAMAQFREELGEDATLLDGLPNDVLPASVEVVLASRPWPVQEVEALSQKLSALSGVTDVRYGQADLQRVTLLLSATRIAALIMGVALSFATILIIYNTIRLTLYARRDEIEIMSLVGATAAFVRAPFVLEGAIQGLIGGLVAAGLLIGLKEVLSAGLNSTLELVGGGWVELTVEPLEFGLSIIFAGILLGVFGSLLAVGKYLKL